MLKALGCYGILYASANYTSSTTVVCKVNGVGVMSQESKLLLKILSGTSDSNIHFSGFSIGRMEKLRKRRMLCE